MEYKLLKSSVVVFKILAWVSLALGVISAVIIVVGGGTPDVPRAMALLSLLVGILYCFFLLVVASGITLLLDLKDQIKK